MRGRRFYGQCGSAGVRECAGPVAHFRTSALTHFRTSALSHLRTFTVACHARHPEPWSVPPVNVSSNLLRSRVPALPASPDAVAERLAGAGFTGSRAVPLAARAPPPLAGRGG